MSFLMELLVFNVTKIYLPFLLIVIQQFEVTIIENKYQVHTNFTNNSNDFIDFIELQHEIVKPTIR